MVVFTIDENNIFPLTPERHCKTYETICFSEFAIFHVYLIQIYFGSKQLIFGFESIGFDIPLYASLVASNIRSEWVFI